MICEQPLEEIFITIVIPTRDRCDTLYYTIQSALSVDYENYEVLISDNASTDQTAKVVSTFCHPKLKYINTRTRLSMSENWEFALNHIENGWVTVIGDDDAMLPGSLKIVNHIIKATNTKAIRSNGAFYRWPSLLGTPYGKLSISLENGYEVRSSGDYLQKVLDGLLPYNQLPMLYNGGFISKCLIDKVKEVTGNIFMSMIPDVYSAIVFSFLTKNYVYCKEPLAINGASHHSGGTAAFQKVKNTKIYDPAEKYYSEKNLPIHKNVDCLGNGRLPRSIAVIVYECFLQANSFHECNTKVSTSPEKQLMLALATQNSNREEVHAWAINFAAKQGIALPNKIKLRLNILFFQIVSKNIALCSILNSISISGSSTAPVHNVYQAAIAAGLLVKLSPSRIKNLIKQLQSYAIPNLK